MQNNSTLEPVMLTVAGQEHTDWTSYEIDSDFLIPADAWSVTLGIPTAKTPQGLRLWSPVKVSLGGETVLLGRIDASSRATSKGERRLSLEGRDLAGVLCDCAAPVFAAREVGLETVINTMVKPLGITRVDMRVSGKREKITVEPGMTAWDALQEVCELNGCWPWFAPDGTLIIGGPDYTAEPVGELILDPEGDTTNVINLTVDRVIGEWFSEVTTLAQTHGKKDTEGEHNVKATVKDPLLQSYGIHRPTIIVDGDCDTSEMAMRRARKIMADGKLSALTIRATVRGHRVRDKDGKGPLWEPGQRVRVISPPDDLDDIYFLMGRRFMGSAAGQTTSLTLKLDNTWIPDACKKPKGKKQKGEGRIVEL